MDDDVEIVMSSLCRKMTRDGITVEVLIYRGSEESDWILEVEDEEGGSTLWDDRFPTEKAALEEFMRTLDKEGIATFVTDTKPIVH